MQKNYEQDATRGGGDEGLLRWSWVARIAHDFGPGVMQDGMLKAIKCLTHASMEVLYQVYAFYVLRANTGKV